MRALYRNWPTALLDRMQVGCRNHILVYNVRAEDSWFSLAARRNGHDVRTINEIWNGRIYDRWYRLSGHDRPATVLDLGANCGYFTVLAGAIGASRIVSIEPEPENLKLLHTNIALNGTPAKVIARAVTPVSCNQPVLLHRYEDPRLHSLLGSAEAKAAGMVRPNPIASVVEVESTSLEDIINEEFGPAEIVDLVKLDIEGLEWDVLASLESEMLNRLRCVVVEADSSMPESLRERFVAAGFSVHRDDAFWCAVIDGHPSRKLPPRHE